MLDNKSYALLRFACFGVKFTAKHARFIVGNRYVPTVIENLLDKGFICWLNPDELFCDELYQVTLAGQAARLENRNNRSTRRIAIFAAFTGTAAPLLQVAQALISLSK